MLAFYKRHKISTTIVLSVLAFILYVIIDVKVYNYKKWKIVRPLEKVIAEKYSRDDFHIQHIGVKDEHGELQVWEIHVVFSLEMWDSPTFLEDCHEVLEMISEYARQHPSQFTLNCNDGFWLSFDYREYYRNMFSKLRFSNRFHYDTEWEKYYDELVDLRVQFTHGLEEIVCYDKLLRLNIDCSISSYDNIVDIVAKMPNLKYIDVGRGDDLTHEEKAKYASEFYGYYVRSSLWNAL